MKPMKTPGVYIVEKNAFPNSVVQVATAVPAFIGYTEKALNGNRSLHMTPWRITSMAEFHSYFGFGDPPSFRIVPGDEEPPASPFDDGNEAKTDPLPEARFVATNASGARVEYRLEQDGERYCLYGAMRLFFLNGGGACYIVSVGGYDKAIAGDDLKKGIATLVKEPEPTMVVIPETTRLSRQDSIDVQQQMLMHCGDKMKNRFAILDIFGGHLDRDGGNPVAAFRNSLGVNFLNFGAAYYPWVETSVFPSRGFTFENIHPDSRGDFLGMLKRNVDPGGDTLRKEQQTLTYTEIDYAAPPTPLGAGVLARTAKGETIMLTPDQYSPRIVPASVSLVDADEGSKGLKKTVDNQGVWTVAPKTGTITFAPAEGFKENTATVKYTAQRSDGTAVPETAINVQVADAVPDTLPEGVNKVTTPGEAVAVPVVATVKPDTVKLKLDGEKTDLTKTDDTGTWTVDAGAGVITLAPADGFLGDASVEFVATDTLDRDAGGSIKVTVAEAEPPKPSEDKIDATLRAIAPLYGEVMDAIARYMNTMPPAAAMAGIYTMVDNNRGVWKAPANVSLNSVVAPTVKISDEDQEDLNVTPQGKSINAIRPFIGEGVLVWGARTLDGNSLDWRYVSVRRTMIMIEESIRLAAKAYVFEPNTSNTWVTMRSMIENFLTTIWKQGGLAGAVPEDAFSVHVGLGDTMTAVDILEGILRITVLVAVTRPAEFIEITFQQQMQKS